MRVVKLFESVEEQNERVPPGTTRLLQVGGIEICLANMNGTLRAIADHCPHLGESLTKGTLNYLGEVVCPWHSYRFDLITGEECERRCSPVKIYPINVGENGVEIVL